MSNLLYISNNIYQEGDYVEYKRYVPYEYTDETEIPICKGIIINKGTDEAVQIMPIDSTQPEWIYVNNIYQHYPEATIDKLSLRIILKNRWKNFIFREVKTVKPKDPFNINYKYINALGFIREKKYGNLGEALNDIPKQHQNRLKVQYRDYFGFTTNAAMRNNDEYYNKEIFFSKKCYRELNLNVSPISADFSVRRGYKTNPPDPGEYICGLVENGEKGLFYRKWFTCSRQFLTLWTMIVEPDHYSLKNRVKDNYETKSFKQIMYELDTNNLNKLTSNVEASALYLDNIYQKIAKAVYKPGDDTDPLYKTYEQQLKDDLLWMHPSGDN